MNPLLYEKILTDLDSLPQGKKAVLLFHWGREHVIFPPYDNIQLAKKILELDKVVAIIGMHPHCVQGIVWHNSKPAFMSLGNFLFPNFHILPPTYMDTSSVLRQNCPVTRCYHRVNVPTYKKWKRVNRESIIIVYNTESMNFEMMPVMQLDQCPEVKKLYGFRRAYLLYKIHSLSLMYRVAPSFVYRFFEFINIFWIKSLWLFNIAKHNGLKWTLSRLILKYKGD